MTESIEQVSGSGVLYIVSTPIGNLDDITSRALQVLTRVDLIAAEDTRHSARLLRHFDIRTSMVACHDHNEREGASGLIERLSQGLQVALISDAGTPLISDPGYHLVSRARAAGIRVVPVPGACALVAALSVSGLPSDRFAFEGFLPARSAARLSRLQGLQEDARTLIFYEAPHRLLDCLDDLLAVFGPDRQAVLGRELTKTFETVQGAPLQNLRDWVAADGNQQRGECVLLIAGCPDRPRDALTAEAQRILQLLVAELPLKKAAAVTAEITGERKNLLYARALELRADN